jgi:hypothetical protein
MYPARRPCFSSDAYEPSSSIRDIVRNPLGGRDDVRLPEVGGHTGPRRNRSTKPPGAIQRRREDLDRDNAPKQTVVSLVHLGHPPAADQFPQLTEPTRTAVEPTTKRLYPGSGARGFTARHHNPTDRRLTCGGEASPIRSTPARGAIRRRYRSADFRYDDPHRLRLHNDFDRSPSSGTERSHLRRSR